MLTIEQVQAELQEEIDLCNKYFIEEDMHKESTEHERLALKIVTMCMQTLSALKDGELEDYKHIKQWKSDIMDSFCKYDVSSFEELVTNARNKAIDDFVKKISESNQGHWRVTRYEHGEAVSETMSYDIGTIRLIAEQLKAGVAND